MKTEMTNFFQNSSLSIHHTYSYEFFIGWSTSEYPSHSQILLLRLIFWLGNKKNSNWYFFGE